MKLITYTNYKIEISDEALLVKPIRDLYNADKSKKKEDFYTQCSIIFFMADPRSTYSYIVDDKERFDEIIKCEGLPKKTKLTPELQKAIEAYKFHCETSSTKLLEAARIAIDKVRIFLRDVDLTKTDKKGKPIYTISSITSAIKSIPQLAKDVTETERIIINELETTAKRRGGDEGKALFEDGFKFNT